MTGRQEPRRMFRYANSYLTVDPALAQAIGLDEAIVLTRISYLLHLSRYKREHADENGTTWVWNSYDEWRCNHFPFFTRSHVIEVIRKLERAGLLVSRQQTSHDRRKLYTIDYTAVDAFVRKATLPMAAEPTQVQYGAPTVAERHRQAETSAAERRRQAETSAAAEARRQAETTAAESRRQADAPTAERRRQVETTPAESCGQAETPAAAERRATANAPQNGHDTASAGPGKPTHRPAKTETMIARNPSLQERESSPSCERNPQLQGRDTPRCYRDKIQQTIQQNPQQETLSTRQRLLESFKVSERVTGYV